VGIAGSVKKLFVGAGIDVRRYRPLVLDPFAAQQFLLRGVKCRTVFDVGAYQGDVTAQYARMFPEADIYSFEPFPQTFAALSQKFAGNSRVHLVNSAVTARSGEASFHVNELAATNSLLPRPTDGRQYFPPGGKTRQTINVPTISLDDFCSQSQIPSPDVLKMDIQGNELEALRGAEGIMQSGKVALIYTETTFVPHYESGVLFGALNAHLNERGFSLFNLYNLHSARFGQLRFGDAIFVSEQLRRDVIDQLPEEDN
jgi:FkbM family methyltransferase